MIINLQEQFGANYIVVRDEYYGDEKEDKLMQLRINGKGRQHIYPDYGKGLLGVWVEGRKNIAQCKAWGFVSDQICETEVTFGFPLDSFHKVARLIKAQRRRKLSPEQRARFVEQGKKNLVSINLKRKKNRQTGCFEQ